MQTREGVGVAVQNVVALGIVTGGGGAIPPLWAPPAQLITGKSCFRPLSGYIPRLWEDM